MTTISNNKPRVAMIGCGKLGLPCAEVMSKFYDVIGYDVVQRYSKDIFTTTKLEEAVKDRDIIFVAVPTPHEKNYDGSEPIKDLPPKDFDYTIVKQVLGDLNTLVNKNQLVVLISTVLPGTTRRYLEPLITNARFIYNPYLIAMGSVKWDMVNPECLIIGTKDGSVTGDAKVLIDFYSNIMENNPKINVGTWDEAETIKITYNTFISAKIGLVNMIQDIAEKNGNINVDVVTDALKHATQRITGPKYLTAGMGDGGACHPRDNIALRWLAEELDLGYDLFHTIMVSREEQARNKAKRLAVLSHEYGLPVVINGRTYKPHVEYTDGSYSELIAHYLEEMNIQHEFVDPLTNDERKTIGPAIFFLAHSSEVTYSDSLAQEALNIYCDIPTGSIVVDPWRKFPQTEGIVVIHYGNTRKQDV